MAKYFGMLWALVVGLMVAGVAQATDSGFDVSSITFDNTPLYAIGLTTLGVLAVIFIIRKVKSLIGR